MRILVVSNLFPPDVVGGYELLAAQAVEELRGRGHDVRVLTSAHGPLAVADGVARDLFLTNLGDGYVAGHTPADVRVIDQLRARTVHAANAQILARHLADYSPDVVYLWSLDGIGGLMLLTLLNLRGTAWVWQLGDCVPRVLCSVAGRVLPPLATSAALVMDGTYIACSRGVVAEIETAGLRVGPELHVIPNWVAPASEPPPRHRDNTLRLSFVSRVSAEKGALVALGAVALCRRAGIDLHLDLYGEVADLTIPVEAGRLGIDDVVTFHGWVAPDRIAATYAEHDLFLFPTWRREPFGLAPIEALAAGCVPLLSTDCGVSEWLVDGVHCLKARPESAAFAATIARIAAGEIDLDGIRARGGALARGEYSRAAVFDRIEAVLRERAARGGRTPVMADDALLRLLNVVERVGLATAGSAIAGRRRGGAG